MMNKMFYPVTVTGRNGELKGTIGETQLRERHWIVFWEEYSERKDNNFVYSKYEDVNNPLASKNYKGDYRPRHNTNVEVL